MNLKKIAHYVSSGLSFCKYLLYTHKSCATNIIDKIKIVAKNGIRATKRR